MFAFIHSPFVDLEQFPIPVLVPVKIAAVFSINFIGELDSTFEVAQLGKAKLPIVQVGAILSTPHFSTASNSLRCKSASFCCLL
jgi:hypothetical protein